MTNDTKTSIYSRADAWAVLAAMVLPTLTTWLYFVVLQDAAETVQQCVFTAGKLLQFGFPIVWVLAVRRERLRLRRPDFAGVAIGIGFGVLVCVFMWLTYEQWLKPGGWFNQTGETVYRKISGFGIDRPTKYVAMVIFYSLGHSFLEEYYYRWFIFGRLQRMVPLGAAVVISSLAFTAHHTIVLGIYFGWFSWMTILFSLAIAVGGAAWALIYQRSNSLLGPWLSHLLVDVAIFVIGYDMVGNLLILQH